MKFDYSKLMEILSAKNKQNIFLITGIIGIVLIAVSNFDFTGYERNDRNNLSLTEYTVQMEKEIELLLKEIEGVGDVKVMITLESGEENIYVQQEKSRTDNQKSDRDDEIYENSQTTYENEFVIVSAQNNNQPLVEKTMLPAVQGVAVVCSGADDIAVISSVTNTVSVVLGISTNRIYVTKMR